MLKTIALLAITGGLAAAQSVVGGPGDSPASLHTSTVPVTCGDASTRPNQMPHSCRVTYSDGTAEAWDGWYQLFPADGSMPQPQQIYQSRITWTLLTEPTGCGLTECTTPGVYTFDWSLVDANGVTHTGTHSGTWTSRVINRWWHPVLLSSTLAIHD